MPSIELKRNAEKLIGIVWENPYQTPPAFEKLTRDLKGACTGRINIQHRFVYQVLEDEKAVKVLRMIDSRNH